ncbi:hypothetical protein LY76DRAFT_518325, partial [Colletotrichum caudatum]
EMLSSRLLAVLGIAGIVTAFPQIQVPSDQCPQTIGGPTSWPPSPTKPPSHPNPKPTPSDSCSTRTICRDFINECGQMYGGCHSDCQPWPSFTAPPCASSELITPSTPPNRD